MGNIEFQYHLLIFLSLTPLGVITILMSVMQLSFLHIHAIMKTMCPTGYHDNDFVATHALIHLGHVMYGYIVTYEHMR